MLELGAYTSLFEVEVARHIQRFGGIAQVWSAYEARRNKAARGALGRGVNSIQWIREQGAWRLAIARAIALVLGFPNRGDRATPGGAIRPTGDFSLSLEMPCFVRASAGACLTSELDGVLRVHRSQHKSPAVALKRGRKARYDGSERRV
jgi:hypothetical protein